MSQQDATYWTGHSTELRISGNLPGAADAARRAISLDANHAPAHVQLAHALRFLNQPEDARQAAERAVALEPGLAAAWFNLGAARVACGMIVDGEAAYRKALELKSDYFEAWSNLGNLRLDQGAIDEGIDCLRRALKINPGMAPIRVNLADALRMAGQVADAERECREALAALPESAAAWNNLSNILLAANRPGEAEEAARKAVALNPGLADVWTNLGNILERRENAPGALDAHREAVRLRPRDAQIRYNYALALKHGGDPGAAITEYREAVAMAPDVPDMHWNLALALLAVEQFADGWDEYDWRWKIPGAEPPRYAFAPWWGDTTGGRLLVWGEQGVGDEILYASMLPELARAALRVTVEIDDRLAPMFRRSFPGMEIVPRDDAQRLKPADFDWHVPIAGLGRWLRPDPTRFPPQPSYLIADAARAQALRARLAAAGARKVVGVSWRSRAQRFAQDKSSTLAAWGPLLRAADATYVDLQYGDTAQERNEINRLHGVHVEHLPDLDLFDDLDGLAALVSACDLVVTTSNVTAHVAGALGRPVWLLLPRGRGRIWYWFSGRADSPWYPSMRIHSQPAAGRWDELLESLAPELVRFTAAP